MIHAVTTHPGWVVTAWLVVTLGAGTVGWLGRDALSSSVLTGVASTDELLDQSNVAPLDATGRYLVCAPSYTSGSSTDRMPWVDLVSSGAEQVSQQAGLCYLAMWDGLEGKDASDAPPDREPSTTPADSPLNSQSSIPLLSPDFLESWQADAGNLSSLGDAGAGIHADIARAERFALPLTLLLLLVATRHPMLAVLPLLAGTTVTVVTGGILIILAQQVTISVYAVSIVTMLGLALGIDYALLWVMRAGKQLSLGFSTAEEATASAQGTSATILMAGAVVFGASLGLLALPLNIFREVVLGIGIAVLVAMLAAITLVPSLVQLAQGKQPISIPRFRGPAMRWGLPALRPRRPRSVYLTAIIGFVILVGLGWQATSLRTAIGIPASMSTQPEAFAAGPYDSYMQDALLEVRLSSLEVVITGSPDDSALREMLAAVGSDPDLAPVVMVDAFPAENAFVLRTIVVRPMDSELASGAIGRVRAAAAAIQMRHPDATLEIGGPLGIYDQIVTAIEQRKVLAGLLAVSIAGVLMTLSIGTPLLSLMAVGGSLLSFAAALGALVLVVQRGFGASLLGVEQAPHIESWAPIVMFCVLLGMGIDYHVFLASGVKDARTNGLPPKAAIIHGYRTMGPVVITAAFSMTLVFGGFVRGEMAAMQQLGIGLAVGVTLDALLVRLLLVPVLTVAVARIGHQPILRRIG